MNRLIPLLLVLVKGKARNYEFGEVEESLWRNRNRMLIIVKIRKHVKDNLTLIKVINTSGASEQTKKKKPETINLTK